MLAEFSSRTGGREGPERIPAGLTWVKVLMFHLTQNRSFQRQSSQPIALLVLKKSNPPKTQQKYTINKTI